jgi:hypothetical protein
MDDLGDLRMQTKPPDGRDSVMHPALVQLLHAHVIDQARLIVSADQQIGRSIDALTANRALVDEVNARPRLTVRDLAGQASEVYAAEAPARQAWTEMWAAISQVLWAAANISKACWGISADIEGRREPLRVAIGISPDSPLRDRTMRDNFDHYDEKMEHFWLSKPTGVYMDRAVSGVPGFGTTLNRVRSYDVVSREVTFLGARIRLSEIVDEAHSIAARAEPWMR